ncbi:MAG: helix-turn-helix transcriptional regulator [Bacteroidales bacterium]|jgi:transcriptional regulator with XRE-family HTH domain|nr:helix-turn-helix transcriptional regulator [Bacteroidales bacterium]MDD4604022.1 helix-turn-helix transcriptional regulator [Bacteroidales bacterium]
MKEKDGFINCPEQQMILYVEKDDGKYGPMQTGSYISSNFLDDFFTKRKNLEKDLRDQLCLGKISPIQYYRILEDLTLSELSARVGIRKSKVKKHLDIKGFGDITAAELVKYALVFNVPVPNLLQVILVEINQEIESLITLENKTGNIFISQTGTANPYFVLTKIEEKKR